MKIQGTEYREIPYEKTQKTVAREKENQPATKADMAALKEQIKKIIEMLTKLKSERDSLEDLVLSIGAKVAADYKEE